MAVLLFAGMMIWTAWVLLASVWAEADRTDKDPGNYVSWHDAEEIAEGPAYQGPWRMNDSDFRYVDDASAAMDDHGNTALVWVDQAKKDVLFQWHGLQDEADRGDPVVVSDSPDTFSWLPRVAFCPKDDNIIYVLWQEIVFSGGSHGGEIFFARSTDSGETFSEPVNLSQTPAGAGKGRLTAQNWDNGSLDLDVGPDGSVYAVWTEYEGALRISRSVDQGESFSEPLTVFDHPEKPARGPALSTGPDGRIHLAWAVGEQQWGDIKYAQAATPENRDEMPEFSEPEVLIESGGHSDAPDLAVDSGGTLHLVYGESADGPFRAYHIYYVSAATGSGPGLADLSEPARISTPHPGDYDSAHFPSLKTGEQDQIYVTWELFPDVRRRPVGLGFTVSVNAGADFAGPVVVPGTGDPEDGANGSRQGLLSNKLAAGPDGSFSIVNSSYLDGEQSRIRLIKGAANNKP